MLNRSIKIACKEFRSFFASPIAYLFLGTFVLVSLYNFFWVDRFFARNIADLRPLFHSLPLLMIFLVSAITMKMWSEERKMGTLEFLLTAPVKIWELVLGKFLACLSLVACALVLSFSLPVTVSILGDLDWGPVIGAYFGTFFLAAAYIAIGLFVSSRSENQIVSLIISIIFSFVFYLIGQSNFVSLFPEDLVNLFQVLSTSTHFNSISRGVIELRDLFYYLSITAIFLSLNILALVRVKWSDKLKAKNYNVRLITVLVVVNLLVANFWVKDLRTLRVDLTKGNIHTLSASTYNILGQIQEPLLIRAYISNNTHPLLAPLIPQIKDTLEAYQSAGKGRITAELLDPKDNPELEEEVARRFNVRPVPLQINDRYQASLVSAYFDIVVQYGDKFETLNFRNLIEVNQIGDTQVDVKLKNLEYDLTRAVKKVIYGFQDVNSLFTNLKEPVNLKAFLSADAKLPEALRKYKAAILPVLEQVKTSADGKFSYEIVDPQADGGAVAQEILEKFGLQPMVASLFDQSQFYFYFILENSDLPISIALPEALTADGFKKSLESAAKRFSPGFLKTIGIIQPKPPVADNPYQAPQAKQFNFIYENLSPEHNIRPVELDAPVAEDIDLVLVLAPNDISEKSLFYLDNFLMRGGTIILATSPYQTSANDSGIMMEEVNSGLADWLKSYGVTFSAGVVLDEWNEPFPAPVKRNLGGYMVEEIKLHNYPPFVDVRGEGFNKKSPFVSGISQVTLNWPSAINWNAEQNANRQVTELLKSSENSWVAEKFNPNPDYQRFPELGFERGSDLKPHTLAVAIQGKFDSYFKGKKLDFLKEKPAAPAEGQEKKVPVDKFASLIERSPESSRLVVFGSNEFLGDQTLQMSSITGSTRYLNSITLIKNAIDISLEDPGLVEIRSRGNFSRTLYPISEQQKVFWEYLNYAYAIVALILMGLSLKLIAARHARKQAIYFTEGK